MSSPKDPSQFSNSLFALKVHLETIFDDAGGMSAIELLDSLSTLAPQEQEIFIHVALKVIARLNKDADRTFPERKNELKEFEDYLYSTIAADIERFASKEESSEKKFQVISGGKDVEKISQKQPIDLAKQRELRNGSGKPFLV